MSAWLEEAAGLAKASPQEVLAWTYRRFRRVALVASFQAESLVLIDMARELVGRPVVITLDTGRLPEATHSYLQAVSERFDLDLRVEHPDAEDLRALLAAQGPNGFRRAPELRHACCDVRKVRPLTRALRGFDAWITGLRRDQGTSRSDTPVVALDAAHGGIAKVAPLAGWTRADVWRYLEARGLDPHPLYARGYASIGCAPCTRAVVPGEDERAGRWWWEADTVKECGLHWAVTT